MRQYLTGLTLLACAAAPLRPCDAQDTLAISRALTANYATFSRAYANRWPDTVTALYAADAVYLAPNQEVVRGRDAIRAVFGFLTQQTGPGPVVVFEISERRYGRDHVNELGYYRMGPAGSDPATLPRVGKFTVVWGRQRDGSWRILSDNYSFVQSQQPTAARPASGTPDSILRRRDSLYQVALSAISGRENQRADSVFRNLRTMGRMPAGRLLAVMRDGYANSLGVDCTHCHVPGDFSSEENNRKQIARDMMAMVTRINTELLPAVPNLRGPQAIVNCSTCHRGQVKPALNVR
jgi:ketosteroid isomerase-like protein